MLDVNNVTKVFSKGTVNEHTALNNLSLHLDKGDFVTIVGSNGAGKSTLFNAVCGSFLCDSGKIILDNEDITYKKEHKRARVIGRVFQDTMKGTAPDMTIEENLALAYSKGRRRIFQSAVNDKMRKFFKEQLARYNMGLEDRLKNKVGLLSGGQRQVVTLLMLGQENFILSSKQKAQYVDSGEIILDIPYNERKNMNRDDLLQMYSMKKREALDNDRILFS